MASAEAPSWGGRAGDTKAMPMDAFEAMLRAKGGTDIILNDPGMKAMCVTALLFSLSLSRAHGVGCISSPRRATLPHLPLAPLRGGCELLAVAERRYMPVIRGDILLEESYEYQAGDVLDSTAIVAFYGEGDNSVDVRSAGPWMDATTVGAPHSRTQALKTSLVPSAQSGPWLNDWYLCQDKDTAGTMAHSVAQLLHM